MYSLVGKSSDSHKASSTASSLTPTSSAGDTGVDDPPLPLSKNMRRKTGGKNPRDLLAEKLKIASRRRQKAPSTESLSSACINGDVIIGNCATSSPQNNNSYGDHHASSVTTTSMHHSHLQVRILLLCYLNQTELRNE